GPEPGVIRNWREFVSKSETGSFEKQFATIVRMGLALAGEDRSPGLDLISRGGIVAVKIEK
ncbi:MAG TPA: hypothetical protein VMR25_27660, partial [Planctomycetaceae bacterium]|nr:hypothetical protein [Planctomycetaceae bacterium]